MQGSLDYLQSGQPSRVRSFPHVEGNYALHVYIPGASVSGNDFLLFFINNECLELLDLKDCFFFGCVMPVHIPSTSKKEMVQFLKRVASLVPGLHVVDIDVPLNILCKEEHKLEQVALGREFHISLGRTVPVRVHQIDSIVTMLRQKLQLQKRLDVIL